MIDDLVASGFTSQEARTYVALLRQPMATGYEVAKGAGLQRANTYSALSALAEKGAAQVVGESPARYVAVPPADVVGRMRAEAEARCDRLEESLRSLDRGPALPALWTIEGRDAVLVRVATMVSSATDRVACSAWAEDLDLLAGALDDAVGAGREVVVNAFGPVAVEGATVFEHEPAERTVSERIVIVSVDRSRALVGTLGPDATAVYTDQPTLVTVVEKLLRDEAYLAAIYDELGSELEDRFGPHLVELRARLLPAEVAERLRTLIAGLDAGDSDDDEGEGTWERS
ncbi:MAG: helix-turn-helix domain-containing protein [Actinomycetota bacterium]|nr:helix-turn-helix domain-containing protein [Actinomycetota bacterium]